VVISRFQIGACNLLTDPTAHDHMFYVYHNKRCNELSGFLKEYPEQEINIDQSNNFDTE